MVGRWMATVMMVASEFDHRTFFVELMRPILIKVVRWIEKTYGVRPKCKKCGSEI